MRKLQVGPPSALVPPSSVATLSPALGKVPGEFLVASSRESPPAYTAFACQTPLCSQSLCLGLCVSAPLQVGWGLGWGVFLYPSAIYLGWEGIRGHGRARVYFLVWPSVTQSILRKVLQESLPLLETWVNREGEG